MRVNSKVFTERTDMFTDLYVKGCPNQLESVANRLLNMVAKTSYSVGSYHTMTELDKKLTADYWMEYEPPTANFKEWYVKSTEASLIERATRWLIEHNYLIVDEEVRQRAQEAARNYRQAVKG